MRRGDHMCRQGGVAQVDPGLRVTRNAGPSTDWVAVAPKSTSPSGRASCNSLSSHGRHATTSDRFGLSWMRG